LTSFCWPLHPALTMLTHQHAPPPHGSGKLSLGIAGREPSPSDPGEGTQARHTPTDHFPEGLNTACVPRPQSVPPSQTHVFTTHTTRWRGGRSRMTSTLTSSLGALLKGRHHPYHHKQKEEESCYAMTVRESRGYEAIVLFGHYLCPICLSAT